MDSTFRGHEAEWDAQWMADNVVGRDPRLESPLCDRATAASPREPEQGTLPDDGVILNILPIDTSAYQTGRWVRTR